MSAKEVIANNATDLVIVGGGVNGCGIARDAAGRGLSVILVEMDDLGAATSSASTKLFHGGLRYLEYFSFRLVKEALTEREVLLKSMPHISWPMRFILPYDKFMRFDSFTPATKWINYIMPWSKSKRPFWLIKLGLYLYDSLGGRKILPPTKFLHFPNSKEGRPLKAKFKRGFEYSDCWVDDSRLVILNARDAQDRGATILPRVKLIKAERTKIYWNLTFQDQKTNQEWQQKARYLINAAGPWVGSILKEKLGQIDMPSIRLVRGSHLVVKKQYDHEKAYFLQGRDGRIVFVIPYEQDFTLIGTTDVDHDSAQIKPVCTDEERDYLLEFVNLYFSKPVTKEDIVWCYSGIRPLYQDGAAVSTSATRDYVLKVDKSDAPLLTIYGGKITTYRKLAENVMSKVVPYFGLNDKPWTINVALPGGDFKVNEFNLLMERILEEFPYLSPDWARRLLRQYGTETKKILNNTQQLSDLGRHFGCHITERELRWSIANEWTQNAEDFIWRRTKLGLKLTKKQIEEIDNFIQKTKKGLL